MTRVKDVGWRLALQSYVDDAMNRPDWVAPDGGSYVSHRWAGGDWGGGCGSTVFVPVILRLQKDVYTAGLYIAFTQPKGDKQFGPERAGDRIECELRHKHEGPCTGLGVSWTPLPYDPDGSRRKLARRQQRAVSA